MRRLAPLAGLTLALYPFITAPALHNREKHLSGAIAFAQRARLRFSLIPGFEVSQFVLLADLALKNRGTPMELQFLDRVLICSDCRSDFVFTAGEQLFFHEKQFKNDPKRCKNCKARRASLSTAAPGVEHPPAVPVRTETRTNCSECSLETTVPFKPTQGRPVLCRLCYQKKLRMPPPVPAPGVPAVTGAGSGLHEAVLPHADLLPPLAMATPAHAVTTDEAVAALAALPGDAHADGISPQASLRAAASISCAQPHSSVATIEDLASIASALRPHDPSTAIPYELLNDLPTEHVELLAAIAETADA